MTAGDGHVADDRSKDKYATAAQLDLMKGFPPPLEKRVDRASAIFGAPQNRWSYQHMRRLYPSAPIAPAASAVTLKRKLDPTLAELTIHRQDGSASDMDTFLRETYTDAFVVLRGETIVFERYENGMSASQPHQMMSVTKSFAGLLALLAQADGDLQEQQAVTKWVPELAASDAFAHATVRHVMDMTNSMTFTEIYDDPNSDIWDYGRAIGLIAPTADQVTTGNLYDYLTTLKKGNGAHGDSFYYQTPKADVVNWVTNRATGLSFEDNMHKSLWSKIGASGETYVLLDTDGNLFAGGGLNASPENLARFAAMMLDNGKFNGQRVVPISVIKKIQAGGDKALFLASDDANGLLGDGHWSYRAQWWVRDTPGRESYNALGVSGQWITIDPKRQVAIVRQASQPEAVASYHDDYMVNAIDTITAHLAR